MDSDRLDVRPIPMSAVRSMRRPIVVSRAPRGSPHFLRTRAVVLDDDERPRFSTRLHWMSVARSLFESSAVTFASFIVSWCLGIVIPGVWQLQAIVWLAAMAHWGRTGWRVLRWRVEMAIVTDRRLLCTKGIIIRVRGWKLERVTNVDVEQSIAGQMLGYGTLRVESGGQHDVGSGREFIRFLPDPGLVARLL